MKVNNYLILLVLAPFVLFTACSKEEEKLTLSNKIQRFSPESSHLEAPGTVSTIAQNSSPITDLTTCAGGFVYFTDSAGFIKKVNRDGALSTLVQLETVPRGIAAVTGEGIFFTERVGQFRNSLFKLKGGEVTRVQGDFGSALTATPDGSLYAIGSDQLDIVRTIPPGVQKSSYYTGTFGLFDPAIGGAPDNTVYFIYAGSDIYHLDPNGGTTLKYLLDQYSIYPAFSTGNDIAVARNGDAYISSTGFIIKIDAVTGRHSILAGSTNSTGYADGTTTEARFGKLSGIHLTEDETVLLVCDGIYLRKISL